MTTLRQIVAVTAMNVRSIPQRLGASCVIVVGTMGVVAVLVSVFTMANSLTGTLLAAGRMDRAVVLRNGTNSAVASTLTLAAAATVANAPGVARTPGGDAAAMFEVLESTNVARRSNGSLAALMVHGISEHGLAVRSEIEIVAGRAFTPGLHELVVGRDAQNEFRGLEIGNAIELRGARWAIVGAYESGDVVESGFLADAQTLMSAQGRSLVNSVLVRLDSPESFEAFETALKTDPSISVGVFREPDFYAEGAKDLSGLFFFVTYVVSGIMACGAVFGALNAMYSAIGTRAREIATLRALGFGASGVVVSVLTESVLLSAVGALAGVAVSWALFSGNTISLGGTVGTIVTELRITPGTVGFGVISACTVGLLGGLWPAVRAARLPVATALRAL